MPLTQKTTYLFVDGRNFRQYFNENTQKWFGQEVEFDFKKIKDFFQAEKAFYYDCVDDVKTENESEQDFKSRVDLQEEKLNKIREVEGCHVHLGTISGKGKKKRQKEVDVLLTVQMMEHAFRGNLSKAVLLSGDKDFRPLVESLVRLGLFVEVVGDQKHISRDLILPADSHKTLSIDEYYNWTPSTDQYKNPLGIKHLSFFIERAGQNKFFIIKKGKWNDKDVLVYIGNSDAGYWFTTTDRSIHDNTAWVSNNIEKLELYFNLKHGQIIWNQSN